MGCKPGRVGTARPPARPPGDARSRFCRAQRLLCSLGRPFRGTLWRRGVKRPCPALPERFQAHPGPHRAAWLHCRSAERWTGRSGSSRCGRSPATCKDRAALSRCSSAPPTPPPAGLPQQSDRTAWRPRLSPPALPMQFQEAFSPAEFSEPHPSALPEGRNPRLESAPPAVF